MNSRHKNRMSLDQFAQIALMDKWMLAGWCIADGVKCRCDDRIFAEQMFQNKYVSRDEIAQAIETAEQMIYEELGYFTAPTQILNEQHSYPVMDWTRAGMQTRYLASQNMTTRDGRDFKSIELEHAFIQKIGTYSEIELAEVSVVINEQKTIFTATYTLPEAPAGDVDYHAYFTETDRYSGEPREWWEIRDIAASVEGTTLTVRGGAYLLLKPSLRTGRNYECVRDNISNFVDKILLYKREFDSTNHGSLQWGEEACTDGTGCNDTVIKSVCLSRADTELEALVRPKPKTYDEDENKWTFYTVTHPPDWVVANYVAGVPLVNGKVNKRYALPTFYLASSLLRRAVPTCGCFGIEADELNKYKEYEKVVLNEYDASHPNTRISTERLVAQKEHLKSPWGGLYGAVLAWNMIQSIKNRDR